MSHEYWISDLARKLDMPTVTLRWWAKRGWINGKQVGGCREWILWADDSEIERLKRLRSCHRGWALGTPTELYIPKNRHHYDRKKAA